jgi:hypothetical protein
MRHERYWLWTATAMSLWSAAFVAVAGTFAADRDNYSLFSSAPMILAYEIARAFLVQETAMSRRITRAKAKIKAAKIPYRVPSGEDLPAREAEGMSREECLS